MKKKNKFWIIAILVLVLVSSIFLLKNSMSMTGLQSFTAVSMPSFKLGSVTFATTGSVGTTIDGNIYYEERCIDTSTYLTQGYKFLRNDGRGCPIVGKQVVKATLDLGAAYRGDFCGFGSFNSCGSGCTNHNPSPCPGGWSSGCGGRLSNDIFWNVVCTLYGQDEKGGIERVQNTCTFAQNDLLVAESFSGGQTITKLSTRYPIKTFCLAHPSIITDDALKQSSTVNSMYKDLLDGKSIPIAASQTLTLFYVIENNKNLPTICDSSKNLALDINSNLSVCKSTLGFTYLCSQGQFDALTGTCVVQPQSSILCEQGRYDIQLNKCVYNPPIQYDCGSNDCFYSVDRNVCSCATKEEFSCSAGFKLYMPTQSECEGNNSVWQLCPQCAADKVCSSDVCSPRCSAGVVCKYDSPLTKVCNDANAKINANGQCEIVGETVTVCPDNTELRNGACYQPGTTVIQCPDGTTQSGNQCIKKPVVINVCPQDTTFDDKLQSCVKSIDSATVCADGSAPTLNPITNKNECVVKVDKFLNCPLTQVYDQTNNKCVDSIQIFNPTTNDVQLYSEDRKGCTANSECTTPQVCNTDLSICQTPISGNWQWNNAMTILVGVIIVCLLLLFVMFKKKRR